MRTYGNRVGGTIEVVQLEFGARLRAPGFIDKTADDLVDAVAAFAKAYLPHEAA